MAITITSPRFSFVQFGETDSVQSCNFPDVSLCLPVYDENDVAFQFVLVTDTEEEADALCDLTNDQIQVGIVESCDDGFLINFKEDFGLIPQRFRISPRQVLYNWEHGLPSFNTVISVGECFKVKIVVDGGYEFCSNCFQRISDPCHTSLLEYGNDENAFGFNYCNGEAVDEDSDTCDPTIIQFTNKSTLVIPYTTSLQAKYGNAPSVQVWIYDENNELVDMGIRVAFDTYPPTELRFDFGGNASGIIKIL